jgi:hypothetical protein
MIERRRPLFDLSMPAATAEFQSFDHFKYLACIVASGIAVATVLLQWFYLSACVKRTSKYSSQVWSLVVTIPTFTARNDIASICMCLQREDRFASAVILDIFQSFSDPAISSDSDSD